MTNTRRDFLKQSLLATLGLAATQSPIGAAAPRGTGCQPVDATPLRPSNQTPVHNLTTAPLEKVRVGIIGLGVRGNELIADILRLPFVEINALCDIRPDRTERARRRAAARKHNPSTYSGDENAWEKLIQQDNLDLIYIATPWEWHCEMSVKTMLAGKHAFVEVPAAVTVEECWRLVDTSERTQRHCVILENCCYGRTEMLLLNMTRQNVLGTLTHAECAYIQDLRHLLFNLNAEGAWRREYHKTINGNLYPTHGLGPVAQYLDIGRGDQFKYLVSMSSPEAGLSRHLAKENPNDGRHAAEKYICGDMNTTLIKTELGRTILLQHDVVSPRPATRINALTGTGGTFFDDPPCLALDDPEKHDLETRSNQWLPEPEYEKISKRYEHPLLTHLGEEALHGGHNGMDYVMNYRLLTQIRRGQTPDMTVYDAALWSCLIELTARSVANNSAPTPIPDFTRTLWKTIPPLLVTA